MCYFPHIPKQGSSMKLITRFKVIVLLYFLAFNSVHASIIEFEEHLLSNGAKYISNGTLDWLNFDELSHLDRFSVDELLKDGQSYNGWRYASFDETHDLINTFFPFFDKSNTPKYISSTNSISGFSNASYRDGLLGEQLITDELDLFGNLFGALIERPSNFESYIEFQFGDVKSGYGDIGGGFIDDYEIVQKAFIFDGQIDWLSWEDSIGINDLSLTDHNGNIILGLNMAHGIVRDTISVPEPTTISLLTLFILILARRKS